MAQQTINLGTVANDGTGDSLRVGGDKINDNFTELYAAVGSGSGGGGPAGRLTLVSGTPILASDQTAKTAVYYTPYIGNTIPLYNGSATSSATFTELTLSLDTTNHTSGNLYDVFVWNDSGTIKVGTGPAWSSGTARGTGAGTTELEMKNGFWTNKVSITLKNGAGSGISGVAANTALYVGTIYATANGQTGVAFQPAAASGGGNPIVGVWNAYNRVNASSSSMESFTGYGYNTATWHPVNGSNSNRVTTIDGLGQTHVKARHLHGGFTSAAGGRPNIGINRDSTTAAPRMLAWVSGTGSTLHQFVAEDNFLPSLGLHYYQAMEIGSAANGGIGSMTWGLGSGQILLVEFDF